jgi:hypothetical protein
LFTQQPRKTIMASTEEKTYSVRIRWDSLAATGAARHARQFHHRYVASWLTTLVEEFYVLLEGPDPRDSLLYPLLYQRFRQAGELRNADQPAESVQDELETHLLVEDTPDKLDTHLPAESMQDKSDTHLLAENTQDKLDICEIAQVTANLQSRRRPRWVRLVRCLAKLVLWLARKSAR